MNEQQAIELVSHRMDEPVLVVELILKCLEDGYGFIERLCKASSSEEVEGALKDCIPDVRPLVPLGRRAAAADSGVSRSPPPRRAETIEEQATFQPDEEQYALALNEWFVKHAATLPEVRSFREKVLGGSSVSTEELRDLAFCFQDLVRVDGEEMTSEDMISYCREQYGEPVERTLSEEEANAFLASPATCCLSLEQFREWGIPVVGHKAYRGVPVAWYFHADLGRHDGLTVDLTFEPSRGLTVDMAFEPSRETYKLRASRSATIDGFKAIVGKQAPAFPAHRWRARSTHEAALAAAIRVPGLLEQWAPDLAHDAALIDRIRKRLNDDDAVLPTQREEQLLLERDLQFRGKRGHVSRVKVWSGSVLDDLRIIGESLAKHYHWDEPDATWFVLTGEPPVIRPLRLRTTTSHGGYFTEAVVSMEVLPWVSWRTVTRLFRQAQRRLVGRNTKRHRLTIEVFRFVTREVGAQISNDDARWSDLLRDWNSEHSDSKRFKWPRDLRQDYMRARQSLLDRDYQPRS